MWVLAVGEKEGEKKKTATLGFGCVGDVGSSLLSGANLQQAEIRS